MDQGIEGTAVRVRKGLKVPLVIVPNALASRQLLTWGGRKQVELSAISTLGMYLAYLTFCTLSK